MIGAPDHGIVATRSAYMADPPRRCEMDPPTYPGIHSGLILTMADGSEWFHPNSGRAPRRLRREVELHVG